MKRNSFAWKLTLLCTLILSTLFLDLFICSVVFVSGNVKRSSKCVFHDFDLQFTCFERSNGLLEKFDCVSAINWNAVFLHELEEGTAGVVKGPKLAINRIKW